MENDMRLRGQYGVVQVRIKFWKRNTFLGMLRSFGAFLMGWMIRIGTWSKYNHAFICLGNNQIVEARPGGAKVSNISEYAGMPMAFSHDYLTEEDKEGICYNAIQIVKDGVGYNYLDIVWLAIHTIFHVNFKWLLKKVLRETTMICSQAVAYSGKKSNYDPEWICGQEYAQEVTPAMLGRRNGVF